MGEGEAVSTSRAGAVSLFSKPIENVTIEDVEAFCASGTPEGLKVEFKREFSGNDKLAKEVSAFANTMGGLILVGVDARDGIPITPLVGIPYVEGLHERVTSICLKNIEGPVIPEVAICRFQTDQSRAVVVIRVDESDETPHRVDQDTKIYVRTARQSEPIQAPWEEVEWLVRRRSKAEENRQRLLARAAHRFSDGRGVRPGTPCRSISIAPLFASSPILEPMELKRTMDELGKARFITSAPLFTFNAVTLAESIVYDNYPRDGWIVHLEVNQFGIVWHKETLWEDVDVSHNTMQGKLNALDDLGRLIEVTTLATKLYEAANCWRKVEIVLQLEGIKNRPLTFSHQRLLAIPGFTIGQSTLDSDVCIRRRAGLLLEREDLRSLYSGIYREYLWSLGAHKVAADDNVVERHLNLFLSRANGG